MYDSRLNERGYTGTLNSEPGLSRPAEAPEGEYILSLRDLLRVLRKRLWIILSVAAVLTGAVVGFSSLQTPVYESSIKILVGQERGTADAPREDVMGLEQLTRTIAEGVNSRPVAEGVIQQLNLQITPRDFLASLSVKQIPNTQFVQVSYRDPSAERAQQVSNTIGDVFSKQIAEVSPSASAITASVWERAVEPDGPASPHPVRNGLLALVLGTMLGVGSALLLEYLDDSWRGPEEAEQVSGVPTFGIIPKFEALTEKKKGGY